VLNLLHLIHKELGHQMLTTHSHHFKIWSHKFWGQCGHWINCNISITHANFSLSSQFCQ